MEREERINLLSRRISRACHENASTLCRVSHQNDLLPGIVMNLMNVQRDLGELKTLIEVQRGRS